MAVGIHGASDEFTHQHDEAFGDPGSNVGLKDVLEADYASLLGRLSLALRSHDEAVEALHNAYVRLGRTPTIGEVRNPLAYLYRMALNLASNVRRREFRTLLLEQGTLEQIPDDAPNPEREALARIDLDRLHARLSQLSERQRGIFAARWRDGLTQEQIADQFRLHRRTVQKELRRVEQFLWARTGHK